ncbi:hypothetical protein VH569_03255 [Azospirillum sp. 11R-A]|uniref:hypothetical protein n=1 Tax=Azospirillum sp. 11R-A TaxID=3111634 RepID=UPI003C1B4630
MSDDHSADNARLRVLSYLKANLKALEAAQIDEPFAEAYRVFLKNAETFARRAQGSIATKSSQKKEGATRIRRSHEDIRGLSLDNVEKIVSDPNASRKELEDIAKVFFGVSPGTLTSLRAKSRLTKKLMELIAGDRSHQSVARLASGEASEAGSADDPGINADNECETSSDGKLL